MQGPSVQLAGSLKGCPQADRTNDKVHDRVLASRSRRDSIDLHLNHKVRLHLHACSSPAKLDNEEPEPKHGQSPVTAAEICLQDPRDGENESSLPFSCTNSSVRLLERIHPDNSIKPVERMSRSNLY